jgi:foldase protein PrsA
MAEKKPSTSTGSHSGASAIESNKAKKTRKSRKVAISGKNLKLLIILAIIAGVLYLMRSLFVVAIVNGRPITRWEVIKELEKQGGAQTLESLTTQILVRQEADKRGVVLEQSEVDSQIKKIEESVTAQGQSLDDALASQNLSRKDFVNQVELQLLVQKMLADKMNITDEQIDSYIKENKDYMISEDPDSDEAREEARQALTQQQMSILLEPLLSEIEGSAKITKFINY